MSLQIDSPLIETIYDYDLDSEIYVEQIRALLKKILPSDLFFSNTVVDTKAKIAYLQENLPIVIWSFSETHVTSYLLCKHRLNAANFFYDIISRWLIPEKRLNIDLFFSSDFYLKELADSPFTIARISFRASPLEIEEIKENQKSAQTEIRLGVLSSYHARRILEFKGLSSDAKTAMIQEKIGSLIQSGSKDYDKSIFSQMQKFLVTCKEEFKNVRDYHHISRIISIFYTIRKQLLQKTEAFPEKRQLIIKFLKTKLHFPEKEHNVLGILVGLNFLKEHEIFEEKHLISAIQMYIPSAQKVDGSFLLESSHNRKIQTLYIEIQKPEEFTQEEIQNLRTSLPENLKGHIEYLMHPIFMPRNEEEVLRNIMVLSKQLRYVQDIPQVIITFDEQKAQDLSFTVIFLRVVKSKSPSFTEVIQKFQKKFKVKPERVRKVGVLRRKYAKEAVVFRILLASKDYLRSNHSVDLYRAREDVLAEMFRVCGEVRDYNGGMIYKQNELFSSLKKELKSISQKHEFLLEKFFFALAPMEMRSIVSVEHLKAFFFMLLQVLKNEREFHRQQDLFYKRDEKKLAVVFAANAPVQKTKIMEKIESLNFSRHELLSFSLDLDTCFMGYLFLSVDEDKKDQLLHTLQFKS